MSLHKHEKVVMEKRNVNGVRVTRQIVRGVGDLRAGLPQMC